MKLVGKIILAIGGFRLVNSWDDRMRNAVIIEAPHTSMWDFVWGRAGLWALGVKCHFLIKKELFFFPLGLLLKSLGAVPVDRGHDKKEFFDSIITRLQKDKNFSLVLTPEGTRKLNYNWKRGFYNFALLSNKPIFLSFIDYEKRVCGMCKENMLIPTGDYKKDFVQIEEFYKNVRAKHPEKFNLSKENLIKKQC